MDVDMTSEEIKQAQLENGNGNGVDGANGKRGMDDINASTAGNG